MLKLFEIFIPPNYGLIKGLSPDWAIFSTLIFRCPLYTLSCYSWIRDQ